MAETKSGSGKKKDKDENGRRSPSPLQTKDTTRGRSLSEIPESLSNRYSTGVTLGTKQFEEDQQKSIQEKARERARDWAMGQSRGGGGSRQSSQPIYDADATDPSRVRPASGASHRGITSRPSSGGGGGQLVGLNTANARAMVQAHTDKAQSRAKERGGRIRKSREGKPQSQGVGARSGGGGGGFESILRILGAMYANQQAPAMMVNTPGNALYNAANFNYPAQQQPIPRSLNDLMRGF